MSEAETPQNRPSSEAVSAKAVYDDIVHRINTLQATLDPDEKILRCQWAALPSMPLVWEAPQFGSRGAIIRAAL